MPPGLCGGRLEVRGEMRSRMGISAAMALVGVALLAAAFLPASAVGGGQATRTLRLNASETTVGFLDPALNYDFIGWRLGYLTCARLLTYPDKPGAAGARLVPEVAKGMPRVSKNGRAYTFTVRKDFRFSDGSAVTPRSFVRAIERGLSPKMQSPAASFVGDIAGADAVLAGKRATPAGVTVKGDALTIRLTQPAADFLARIAMVFFCAVPEDLPIDPDGVKEPPGAGPYYVAEFTGRAPILLRRNPYYRGRPSAALGQGGPQSAGESADELPAGEERGGRSRPGRPTCRRPHGVDPSTGSTRDGTLSTQGWRSSTSR